ncbi:MAG TPA: glycosyltransferase family 4 protein [Salinivirgaceae bacterium]|nr:glycosyltransferase family 4 protein [Salinivirgaceae bacterium]
MNILFITLSYINSLQEKGIYQDLLRKFAHCGHNVYIAKPIERRYKKKTYIEKKDNAHILHIRTLNIQKTNVIEKGIGTVMLEYKFKKAINKYYKGIKFDLILYSTPPITHTRVIDKIKRRDNAKTYLLLKDIFPQNAIDLGMFTKKNFLYFYFRRKEKRLYKISDYIGCMSPANVEYVIKHNPKIDPSIVEVCPNSIELSSDTVQENREVVLAKYKIPNDKTIFVYGGNLGKPQGLYFMLKVLDSNRYKKDRFFVIAGSGTEYPKIENWFTDNKPKNAVLIKQLPKEEYENLVKACNIGMIFLDPRFTIPNYPSRLLSYLKNKMPVLMATDINTDIGKIAEANGYGFWCESGDLKQFNLFIDGFCNGKYSIETMGNKGYKFLKDNYTVDKAYNIIMNHF